MILAASGQASDETDDILSQSVAMADDPLRLVAAGLRPAAKADASRERYAAADCGGAGKPWKRRCNCEAPPLAERH